MNNDLYDNPMIRSAKKQLTKEQLEEYKRIGEYMYNNVDYHQNDVKASKIKESNPTDLLTYAVQALKSGGDPKDLTPQEINMLVSVYGDKWYEKFGLEEQDVPNPLTNVLNEVEKKMKNANLSRQQRRMIEKKLAKERKALARKEKK